MAKTSLDQNKWDFAIRCVDPEILAYYAQPESDSQELLDLRDRLLAKVQDAVKTHLTQRQQQMIDLYYMQGRTQQDIADMLGCHQTNVFIALHGTTDYKQDPPKRYGGAIHKLNKYLQQDPEVIQILEAINGQDR